MLVDFKRLLYALSNKIWQKISQHKQDLYVPEKKYTADFTRLGRQKSPFNIKSESSYYANLSENSLEFGLKKINCIAWLDIPEQQYRNFVIEAKIRLDSLGGYAATGIVFRLDDEDAVNNDASYYLALVSNKGYFRADAVKDGSPRTLIAWTEISNDVCPDSDETNINLKIIAYGTTFVFLVNDKWLGEANDHTLAHGRLGLALASYPENNKQQTETEQSDGSDERTTEKNEYACKVYLDYFSVDTRYKKIEEEFIRQTDDSNINAEERLRLAETFAVMGEAEKSLEQINRAWKRRDETTRSVTTTYTGVRTCKELLLAARMSFHLGQYNEADEYINMILDQEPDDTNQESPEIKPALTEKLRILNELNRFTELKDFVLKHQFKISKDIDYYTLTGRCYWELGEYEQAAEAWDTAFEMNKENGVYASNAANAYESAGNKQKALKCFLDAGRIFLNQDNKAELAALMPKLSVLGSNDWEARTLAGKWAYSIEDYNKSEEEFSAADKLRRSLKPRPAADPASDYLLALILNQKGKNREAIRLLEKAVKQAPDYGLFRFKLAEIKIKCGIKDPGIADDLRLALKQIEENQPDAGISAEQLADYAKNLLLEIKVRYI